MTGTITIWECQDCGALYSKETACYCTIDDEGNRCMKGSQVCRNLGTFTSAQIKKLRPFRESGNLKQTQEIVR